MRYQKYTNQSTPKAWRKKKTPLDKKIKMKQRLAKKGKSQATQPTPTKTLADVKSKILSKQKKPAYFYKKKATWKLPTAFTLGSLLTIILIIPSLIVGPGDDESASEEPAAVEATAEQEGEEAAADLGASPFSVAVMRSTTETVENIPLEEYVAGVVSAEMPADFEMEALKAQSLAARTYTVNHLLYQDQDASENYDVTDTVQHQVYKSEEELMQQWGSDFDWKMNRIKEAVSATKGEILTFEDTPITAAFFSTSNGKTENSEDYWENEIPYLRSVESPWDKESPKFTDQQTFSIAQLSELLEVDLPNQTPLFIEETRTASDRVDELSLEGYTFSGREVREKLNLPSSDFTIRQSNNHLIFTTEGYGHGVGMSQFGANGMAKEGKTYQEIIKHYYQGVEISTVTETAPTLVSN